MKDVLILGSSGGIGTALCDALRARNARVTGLSRSEHGFDITDEKWKIKSTRLDLSNLDKS